MKQLVETFGSYILLMGVSLGTLVTLLLGARQVWEERGGWQTWPAVIGLISALFGYLLAGASVFYQWRYGFDFNDPTIRMKFVRPISLLAAIALIAGFCARRNQRTAILISSVLVQMYCVFQIDEI